MTDITLPAPHGTTASAARIRRISDAVVASYIHDIASGAARGRRLRGRAPISSSGTSSSTGSTAVRG